MGTSPRQEREQLERRGFIIDTAEKLFLTKGYEETSMDDLAAASEYTKRTLYRYFTCKEDLYYAVTLRGYRQLTERIREKTRSGGNGFEKVRLAFEAFHSFYQSGPAMLRLISQAGAIKSAPVAPDVPYRQEANACERALFEEILWLFEEGQADGSIRADREAGLLAFSSVFMTTGFFLLLAQSGGSYARHFGLDMDAFIQCAMEMTTGCLERDR